MNNGLWVTSCGQRTEGMAQREKSILDFDIGHLEMRNARVMV